MSCFNLLAGILPEPPTKQFASPSESQLDELMRTRHSKKTKDGYVLKQIDCKRFSEVLSSYSCTWEVC